MRDDRPGGDLVGDGSNDGGDMRGDAPEHYFTARPLAPAEHRRRTVRLVGREVEVTTAGGVFSGDRLDLGTSVLLREAPTPPAQGSFLDIGCGWGPLALSLALLAPHAKVWAVDVNERALELTRRNAADLGLTGVTAMLPGEVPDAQTFDVIWSNPPIRIGKQPLHDLLLQWLPRLSVGGDAYLVVQRNLGADSLQAWLTGTLGAAFRVERFASAKGFRVLHVHRLSDEERTEPA